jgi:hypothetical protein
VSVLLPNAQLGLRRRYEGGEDAHGADLPTGWGAVEGPLPGYQNEQADSTWVLGLDPDLWPVRQNDMVIDTDTGGSWLIVTADLVKHPIDDTVDWVRLTANQRAGGGTEPGGAWFVNRFTPDLGPDPYRGVAGLFTGHGAPTAATPGLSSALPGDEYVDLDTGVVYQLGAS